MNKWTTLATEENIAKTIAALKENNIEAELVESQREAKKKILDLLPEGAEVLNATSMTLDVVGVTAEIAESGKYNVVKKRLVTMDRATQHAEMQKLGSAPAYVVGSVHAVTQDGHVVIASGTGSQLPAYAYGSSHVIWLVGTHKIVTDLPEALHRIYEHSLPLESERARKAYGSDGSSVNKLLIINKDTPGRINLFFIHEALGF